MLGFRSQDEIFTTARSSAEKDHIHTAAINGAMKGATIGALAGMLLTFDKILTCFQASHSTLDYHAIHPNGLHGIWFHEQ